MAQCEAVRCAVAGDGPAWRGTGWKATEETQMQTEPTALAMEIPAEVSLPKAPLEWVVAQVRFPTMLSICKEDVVADFQESLQAEYPYLRREMTANVSMAPGQDPSPPATVTWRLSDRHEQAAWQVSLGVDFVALDTWKYDSRRDFLDRLRKVLVSVEERFQPTEARRVGLRYVNRLKGAALDKIGEFVPGHALGIMQSEEGPTGILRRATDHWMTQSQFVASEGLIHGRWGSLPPNAIYDPNVLHSVPEPSWFLDLDMFSSLSSPFESEELLGLTEAFAKRIYSVFRLMVTDEFLRHCGGTP